MKLRKFMESYSFKVKVSLVMLLQISDEYGLDDLCIILCIGKQFMFLIWLNYRWVLREENSKLICIPHLIILEREQFT